MSFTLEVPEFRSVLNARYNELSASNSMPNPVNFREQVRQNLDAYGKYSCTLCQLWRDSVDIPLLLVPSVINSFPERIGDESLTLREVAAHRKFHLSKYQEYDTFKRASKPLTSMIAAGNDLMLLRVTGHELQVPPITTSGIYADAEMLHFLCRRHETGETVSEYEALMEGGEISC